MGTNYVDIKLSNKDGGTLGTLKCSPKGLVWESQVCGTMQSSTRVCEYDLAPYIHKPPARAHLRTSMMGQALRPRVNTPLYLFLCGAYT